MAIKKSEIGGKTVFNVVTGEVFGYVTKDALRNIVNCYIQNIYGASLLHDSTTRTYVETLITEGEHTYGIGDFIIFKED